MDYAQIIRQDTNTPVNLANADGAPYAAENAVVKPQSSETQVIDSDIALASNKQIFGTNAAEQQKALLSLRTYTDGDGNVTAEQAEFGSTATHANFNSTDRPTVELAGQAEKEEVAFLSDIEGRNAHEVGVVDLASLGIAGLSGTLSWIVVELSPLVSDISVWGNISTDSTITAGYHNILTLTDEPLFARFVGVVEKVALNIPADDQIGMLPYKYDENGMTLYIQKDGMQQSVSFQDRLFLIANIQ